MILYDFFSEYSKLFFFFGPILNQLLVEDKSNDFLKRFFLGPRLIDFILKKME